MNSRSKLRMLSAAVANDTAILKRIAINTTPSRWIMIKSVSSAYGRTRCEISALASTENNPQAMPCASLGFRALMSQTLASGSRHELRAESGHENLFYPYFSDTVRLQ